MEWFFNGKGLAQKGFKQRVLMRKGKPTTKTIIAASPSYKPVCINALISTHLTEFRNQLQLSPKLMHRIDSKRPASHITSQSIYLNTGSFSTPQGNLPWWWIFLFFNSLEIHMDKNNYTICWISSRSNRRTSCYIFISG